MKGLLLVSVLLLQSFLFPRDQPFKERFSLGKIWKHETLQAPFSFPIYKTREELSREQEVARENSPLVFRHHPESESAALNEFSKALDESIGKGNPASSESFRILGEQAIRQVYHSGILTEQDEQRIHAAGDQGVPVLLINNDRTEESTSFKLFTISSAREYVSGQLKNLKESEKSLIFDLIAAALVPSLEYEERLTRKILEENISAIPRTMGLVQKDELIISKKELVTEKKFRVISSLRTEYESRFPSGNTLGHFAGILLLIGIALLMLFLFLFFFRKDIFADNKKILLLLLFILMISSLYFWVLKSKFMSIYLVPVCILPIVLRAFFDTRLALFTHLILVLILGFQAQEGFDFAFLQVTAGMVAIFSIANLKNRSQFFVSSALVFITYCLGFTATNLLQEGSFTAIDLEELKWFGGNALMVLFAYPMIYFTEKIFGFVSDVSLLELSDSNSPLLRELATRAPGTFQHSLQVSNLSEAVIYKIGGNALMIRAAALYHDIGKMEMPHYFIENQGTAINPHDDLPFEESAEIIISHVIRGIEIARKHQLPDQLVDFIRTHHGTTRVQYFYRSFLKTYPDKLVDEQKFRYPGPLPFSKETAVLMMADSVEASARSLKQPNEESLGNLVEKVIDNLIAEKQFDNCNITFRDIYVIKKTFKKMLASIHHLRVEYPK